MTETMSRLNVVTGGRRATTVQTVGLAGALAAILMWLGGHFVPELFRDAPPGIEAAFTAVFSSIAGLLFKHRG